MIIREKIAKFTPENQVLRPDYLGVGPTGVESVGWWWEGVGGGDFGGYFLDNFCWDS